MKFKPLFLSATLLVAAALFSYCTKETVTPEPAPVSTDSDKEATSRGFCKVNIQAVGGTLDICGTQNNLNLCGSSGALNLFGNATIPINTNQTFGIATPAVMLVSRNPGAVSSFFCNANVTTSSGANLVYPVPVMGTVQVNIGDLCNLF